MNNEESSKSWFELIRIGKICGMMNEITNYIFFCIMEIVEKMQIWNMYNIFINESFVAFKT